MTRRRKLFRLPWRSAAQIRADVEEELRFHLDMRVEALAAEGLSAADARARALREFGDLEDARRYMDAVDRNIEAAQRRSEYMSDFLSDVVYACRKLRAAPIFSAAVVLTLALGIGANTAIFSVVNRVLLHALPFPDAERLIRLQFFEGNDEDAGSAAELEDFRTRSHTLGAVAMYTGVAANLVRPDGEAERLTGVQVSANWFDVLRTTPLVGRTFASGEDGASAAKVVVLSEGVWRRDFHANRAVVGQGVRVNGDVYTVVGVIPTAQTLLSADVWLPFVTTPGQVSDNARGMRWVSMIARLRDGATFDAVRADLHGIAAQNAAAFPKSYHRDFDVRPIPLQQSMVQELRKPLLVIMVAVGLVLLIACANVANLMLVRAAAREGELAIRASRLLGAARLNDLGQLGDRAE